MVRRRGWGLWIAPVAGVIAVVALAGPALAAGAADFSLDLFDGKRLALKDLRGRAVVVNFWAST